MNKNQLLPFSFLLLLPFISGCQAIGDIFKTGVGVGIFIVVFIIIIIVMVASRVKK